MFTGNEDHTISLQDAAALTQNFRNNQDANTTNVKGMFFSKAALISLLSEDNCVGARIYYGLNNDGETELVIVGTKANGDDLTSGIILDRGHKNPPYNSSDNEINS